MSESNITEKENLRQQILQLREAITAIENQAEGVPSIQPEEVWTLMQQNMGENEPIHPRLRQILMGHVDVEKVKRGLKRLENDLSDLERIQNGHELYDPFEHEMEEEDKNERRWTEEEDDEEQDDSPAMVREEEQRPLTAYMNAGSE